ncbi:MAG: hypothetical protein ABR595_03765 [Psychroflexus sp.]
MKKFFSIIALSAMTLSLSSFSNQSELDVFETSCFEGSRTVVLILDGEINIDNVGLVNELTRACENGDISYN